MEAVLIFLLSFITYNFEHMLYTYILYLKIKFKDIFTSGSKDQSKLYLSFQNFMAKLRQIGVKIVGNYCKIS